VIRRGPTGAANWGVVALHGRGGAGGDILSVLDAAGLPGVAGVAPEAAGHSWWPTSFLAPAAQTAPFLARGLAAVAGAVALLEAQGIPRGRVWLMGFSQGACLALEAFARAGEGLAGAMAFSGGLLGTGDAPGEPDPALYGQTPKQFDYAGRRDGARVWLSVHARDPHIPLARVQRSAAVLEGLGAGVETVVYPGAGHAVMRDDLAWLRARLNAGA
jgi:predicted esterase